MKLNYRDKIILAVILALAILALSYFGLIKKKSQEITDNKARLEELNNQKEEIQQKIDMIPTLQQKIKAVYDDTNTITSIFVDRKNVEGTAILDQYMRKFADDNKVRIVELEATNPKVEKIEYYYYEMEDKEKELRKAADLGGSLEADYKVLAAENDALSARNVESIIRTQYGIKVVGTKAEIWAYLKAIKDYDEAITIDSVNIQDYSFGEDAAKKEGVELGNADEDIEKMKADAIQEGMTDEEIEAALAAIDAKVASVTSNGKEITNTSQVEIAISLYSVYNMSEPDLDYIPSESEVAK